MNPESGACRFGAEYELEDPWLKPEDENAGPWFAEIFKEPPVSTRRRLVVRERH